MSSVGNGYDLSVTSISPDGRVFQIEYAQKRAQSDSLICGYQCRDGVILAAEKWIASPLLVASSGTKVMKIADHAACVATGLRPDARHLAKLAIENNLEFENSWGREMPGCLMAKYLGFKIHQNTIDWSSSPYGCLILLATRDLPPKTDAVPLSTTLSCPKTESKLQSEEEPHYTLWSLDPAGNVLKYRGLALGLGSTDATTMLEQLNANNQSIEDVKPKIIEIVRSIHDQYSALKKYAIEIVTVTADKITYESYDEDGALIDE